MRVGDDLSRRNDEAQLGRLGEFAAPAIPIAPAQYRRLRVGVGNIPAKRRAGVAIGHAGKVGAEEARVEDDELDALALGPDDAAFMDAGA